MTEKIIIKEVAGDFDPSIYHSGISVDCVILGFGEGTLKVLLSKLNSKVNKYMLPCVFPYSDEDVGVAAKRCLQDRVGFSDVYMRQFYLFGNASRGDAEKNKAFVEALGLKGCDDHWLFGRFVTVGYYALVDYREVNPKPAFVGERLGWFNVNNLPQLYSDQCKIIQMAIEAIRMHLGYVPLGYKLLPKRFTMPELKTLYELILGESLDRRNFRRKMLSSEFIRKLDEQQSDVHNKVPSMYGFVDEKYKIAFEFGLRLIPWSKVL